MQVHSGARVHHHCYNHNATQYDERQKDLLANFAYIDLPTTYKGTKFDSSNSISWSLRQQLIAGAGHGLPAADFATIVNSCRCGAGNFPGPVDMLQKKQKFWVHEYITTICWSLGSDDWWLQCDTKKGACVPRQVSLQRIALKKPKHQKSDE